MSHRKFKLRVFYASSIFYFTKKITYYIYAYAIYLLLASGCLIRTCNGEDSHLTVPPNFVLRK